MSGVTERFIVCNKCGESHGVDNRELPIWKHRQSAAADGWRFFAPNKDLCPKCAHGEGDK